MYIASFPYGPTATSIGHHLNCGQRENSEKNWIPFSKDGQLHFIYSPVPHAVAVAGIDGSCTVKYRTTFGQLRRLQRKGFSIRGSGQAVLVDDPVATPNFPRKHYLALLHVVDPVAQGYANFAYRFGAEPPFPILQVSSQLPLSARSAGEHSKVHGKAPFAFASGLMLQNRTVVISYGAGDREARALVLTLARLDQMFNCDIDNAAKSRLLNSTARSLHSTAVRLEDL